MTQNNLKLAIVAVAALGALWWLRKPGANPMAAAAAAVGAGRTNHRAVVGDPVPVLGRITPSDADVQRNWDARDYQAAQANMARELGYGRDYITP